MKSKSLFLMIVVISLCISSGIIHGHDAEVKCKAMISDVSDFKNVYINTHYAEKKRVHVKDVSFGFRDGYLVVNFLSGITEDGKSFTRINNNPAPSIESFDELVGTKLFLNVDTTRKYFTVLAYVVSTDSLGNVKFHISLKNDYGTVFLLSASTTLLQQTTHAV